MAKINLLPWREERRLERQKEFFIMLVMVVVVAIVCTYLYALYLDRQINEQQQRNNFLQQKVMALDVKIKSIKGLEVKRQQVLERFKALQVLQTNRSEIVKQFNAFPRIVPQGVYLTKLLKKGDIINFDGIAKNNKDVSIFMQALDKTSIFSKLTLHFVKGSAEKNTNGNVGNKSQKIFNIEALVADKRLSDKAELKSGDLK